MAKVTHAQAEKLLRIKQVVKPWLSVHRSNCLPPVFMAAIPRAGSNWVMEVVCGSPGFRGLNEPFNLRFSDVSASLPSIQSWEELVSDAAFDARHQYLEALVRGSLCFLNPSPFLYWRFITSRTFFKIIHLPVAQVIRHACVLNAPYFILLRHPIAVALSRKSFPLLEEVSGDIASFRLNDRQLSVVKATLIGANHLELGVLAWCLHYFGVDLSRAESRRIFFYERLVVEPKVEYQRLFEFLDLDVPSRVDQLIERPSKVATMSNLDTQRVLRDSNNLDTRKEHLTTRWMTEVTSEEKARVQAILDAFNITCYSVNDPQPIGLIN
jgi:hypothetical protein